MNAIELSNLNITIVGLGLIGGSFAKALRKNISIKNIWAVDLNLDALNKAKDEGVITEGYTKPEFPLRNSDIVIFCIYPNATVDFIKKNMAYFKHNSLLTDTAGIKDKISSEINFIMREDVEFIGGHPMSGRETTGYEFSTENMFEDSEYILTPYDNTSKDSIAILTEIIKSIGFKTVTLMGSGVHDKRIAFTSQLPHIIACSLMNNPHLEINFSGIGGSFRDVTRIADINHDLWCELIIENRTNVLNELDNFIRDINNIYGIIEKGDSDSLKSIFKKSSMLRKEMNA